MIGIAIGIASFTVPLYIGEISPTKNRGAMVTLNQLMICIGVLVSYISDYAIADDANLGQPDRDRSSILSRRCQFEEAFPISGTLVIRLSGGPFSMN